MFRASFAVTCSLLFAPGTALLSVSLACTLLVPLCGNRCILVASGEHSNSGELAFLKTPTGSMVDGSVVAREGVPKVLMGLMEGGSVVTTLKLLMGSREDGSVVTWGWVLKSVMG